MGKIGDYFREIRFKCMYCDKKVINDTWKKRFEGLSEEGICLKCLKDKLDELK